MVNRPLTRTDLRVFLSVTDRGLGRALRDLGISPRGGTTRWPVVWQALGLAETQNPAHHTELMAPLLTALEVADLLGVADPSILYRWEKGRLAAGLAPFPISIDLAKGRENARAKRWRRAEVLAWHCGHPLPRYAKPAPIFGSLTPAP